MSAVSHALALLAGALLAASFPKFGHSAFAWIALAPLLVALGQPATRSGTRALWLGFLTGIVYFAGTLYWVAVVMQAYGGLPTWVALLIGLLLWAYLALYPATFAWLAWRSLRRFGVAGVWLSPLFWVATEWARSAIFIGGFPWAPLGSSQATALPVLQVVSITGVYGLSALVACVSAAAAALALSRARAHRVGAGAMALVLTLCVGWGALRITHGTLTQAGTPLRVGLVQGNVDQSEKWDPRFRLSIVQRYLGLTRRVIDGGADLVIWPESSTPFYLDLNTALAEPIRRLAADTHTPLIVGTDEFVRGRDGGPNELYNTAVLVGEDGQSRGSYRKMRLVPFGEYVPFKNLLFFVGPLVEAVGGFNAGSEAVVFNTSGRRVSVAICYEQVYPWIAREFVNGGSQLLATITNDAWFGRSSAAYQHFEQSALRAVEQSRYVVRAANTGISGAIDPYGRVLHATELFTADAVSVDVRLLEARTIYSRVGDVVVWLSLAVVAWFVVTLFRRRPFRASPSSL